MTALLSGFALVLIVTLALGLVHVLRARIPADRMLAAQLMGTTTVAILVVLASVMDAPSLLDVALVFALLAAVTLVAFVAFTHRRAP